MRQLPFVSDVGGTFITKRVYVYNDAKIVFFLAGGGLVELNQADMGATRDVMEF